MSRLKKHRQKILVILLLVVLLLAVSTYVGHETGQSQNNKALLRNELIQNSIILDNIGFVDASSPQSAQQHKIIGENLKQNIEKIALLLPALSDDTQKQTLRLIIDGQKQSLDTYSANISALEKVLSYSPADDFDGLEASELTARAIAARDGIGSVLDKAVAPNKVSLSPDSIKLSGQARQSLEESKNCFDRLSQGLTAPQECIDDFSGTMKNLNQELQKLWLNEQSNRQKTDIDKLIVSLGNQ